MPDPVCTVRVFIAQAHAGRRSQCRPSQTPLPECVEAGLCSPAVQWVLRFLRFLLIHHFSSRGAGNYVGHYHRTVRFFTLPNCTVMTPRARDLERLGHEHGAGAAPTPTRPPASERAITRACVQRGTCASQPRSRRSSAHPPRLALCGECLSTACKTRGARSSRWHWRSCRQQLWWLTYSSAREYRARRTSAPPSREPTRMAASSSK